MMQDQTIGGPAPASTSPRPWSHAGARLAVSAVALALMVLNAAELHLYPLQLIFLFALGWGVVTTVSALVRADEESA